MGKFSCWSEKGSRKNYRLADGDECPVCQRHVELRNGSLKCQGECETTFIIGCDHERLELLQAVPEYKDKLVVDVMCKDCRLVGSVTIMPDDVLWDRDE
jgi:hypothetical protein